MKMFQTAIVVLCVLFFESFAYAANPADLTSVQRLWTQEGYMVAHDADKSNWVYVNVTQSETSNVAIYASFNDATGERSTEFFFTKRVSRRLDVTFDTNIDETPFAISNTLSFDFPFKNGGLGFVLPLQSEDDVKIGGRLAVGDFTFFVYSSLESDRNPRWGMTHKGFLATEVAFREDQGKTYLRLSKSFSTDSGLVIPGLRFENQGGRNSVGFSLLLIP